MPLTNSQAKAEPVSLAGWLTTGPMPPARTTAQIKKAMAAQGTKYALTVKRWRIWWTGNQIAGRESSQKMKKLTQSAVVVPESAGKVFGIVSRSFHSFLSTHLLPNM